MSSFNKAQYTKEGSFWQLGLDNLPKSNEHTTQEFTSLNIEKTGESGYEGSGTTYSF